MREKIYEKILHIELEWNTIWLKWVYVTFAFREREIDGELEREWETKKIYVKKER